MTKLNLPKMPDSPMFVDDVITIEWQEFFRGLFVRTGSTEASNVDDLEKLLLLYPESKNYDKKIEDLEAYVFALVSDTRNIDNDEIKITTHTTDKTLAISELNQIHIFNSVSDLTCYLPSVDSSELGKWIMAAKAGTGDLIVQMADSDTALDSTAGGFIDNNDNDYTMPSLGLILLTSTHWGRWNGSFGVWHAR